MNKLLNRNLNQVRQIALEKAKPFFSKADETAFYNTQKVLSAFRKHRVSDVHFRATSGYGYNDFGRETLDAVWAEICQAEQALFRSQFVSGTHALATVLFGLLRPGDQFVSLTGTPYDTMQTVIGYPEKTTGSLAEYGIDYAEIPMSSEGGLAYERFSEVIDEKTKLVLIQRSRGYSMRSALTIADIRKACERVHAINPNCICFVDNCYGEFVEQEEPTAVGADIMAGSLIKNPGGGLAPSGGYIAGKKDLVEAASYRLTAPGIGLEVGASLADNRLLYQGLFLAPHVVAQAIKSAIYAASLFHELGYEVHPAVDAQRSDIIQAIVLENPEKLTAFCQGLQKWSPVDAFVRPEPSAMPGYSDSVIMAAGTFVQGASIELSADAPLRAPFAVYLQGSLTFEHAMLGITGAAEEIMAL